MSDSLCKTAESAAVKEVFITFLKLGLSAFGGPVAHLGFFQAVFVEQKRWLSSSAYAELVALCQFIPGPASSQVGFAIGLHRVGIKGAIAAWIGFTLPSAILMFLLGISLFHLDLSHYDGLLQGLKISAVAVVSWALWSMAKTLTPDLPRRGIALTAAVVALMIPGVLGQLGALVCGALLAYLLLTPKPLNAQVEGLKIHLSKSIAIISGLLFLVGLMVLPILAFNTNHSLLLLSDSMYRAGSLVFGGGHVVLPLLHAETVNQQLVTADNFLAGYGAAQAMPGPLFSFSAFIGAQANGSLGALIAVVSIFLPGCLLLLAILPAWQAIRTNARLQQLLLGVNAAVVGLLAAALYNPVIISGIRDWKDLLLACVLLSLLASVRLPVLLLVIMGALAGWLFL